MYQKCSILKDGPVRTIGSAGAVDPQVKPILAEGQFVQCITVPREEYDKLVAERDRYKAALDSICGSATAPSTGDSSDPARVEYVHILRGRLVLEEEAQGCVCNSAKGVRCAYHDGADI